MPVLQPRFKIDWKIRQSMRYSSSSRNSKRNGRSSNDRAEICEQTLYASWYTDSRVVIRRSVGTKGTAEAQVGVSWPESLIIASIVVVNVVALCRKWPVNITAVPFTKPARHHRPATSPPTLRGSPKIPRGRREFPAIYAFPTSGERDGFTGQPARGQSNRFAFAHFIRATGKIPWIKCKFLRQKFATFVSSSNGNFKDELKSVGIASHVGFKWTLN